LLVIDSADEPGLLARPGGELVDGDGWLRPVPVPGLVLVTSRDARWPGWCRRHQLGLLDAGTSAQVLLDHAPHAGTRDQARSLATGLGGLPLALRLAGSYLAATTGALIADPGAAVSFAGYLAAWRAAGGLPRAREPGGGTGRDRERLGRTWELSLDLLAARGLPQARVLLRLLSVLADAPIPYRLLLDPRVVAASALLPGQDAAGLSRLLRGLSDVGLAELDPTGVPLARIHPLVRQASRPAGDAADYHRLAVDLLCQAAGDNAGTPEVETWPTWRLLAPHAFAVAREVASVKQPVPDLVARAGAVALVAGRVLDPIGAFALAQSELQAVYDGTRRVLGEENPATLAERHELAVILRARGRYAQAQAELQAVYEIRRRVLGDEHRDTLATRHLLAGVLRAQGRYGRAQAELQAVHEGFRQVLGDAHPRTLLARHVLALVLRARGQYEQALAEERAAYEGLRQVLGPENPNTLLARQALAVVRHECGQTEEARAELETVYATWRRELGPEHPDTLAARHDLARVLHAGGAHEAAQTHLDAVYDIRRRVLGDEHPDTLAARHDLARVWYDRGHHERAHTDLKAVYGIRRRVLGSDHPDTVALRRWLRENPR
jgi:tetratricopeptide (TPR) repeat protein